MLEKSFRDVVVFLPGIMGSVLSRDGNEIWAPSAGAITRAALSLGDSVQSLAMGEDDPAIEDLGDGISATRLLPDVHLIPGFWKIDGYSTVVDYIVRAFKLERGRNFFEFPYDWRRDNRATARRLARETQHWLRDWRRTTGNAGARLILIGHSMGGLIARYFVEVMEGWRDTRLLLTLGTPHRGSLNALNFISNGLKKKVGPVTLLDLSELVRSFTSVYQLLPVYPCVEDDAGTYRTIAEIGSIPALDRDRAENALRFHAEIQNAFEANQANAEYRRSHALRPVVGMFQETLQSAILRNGLLECRTHHGGEDLGGDGTVPRVSAVPRSEGSQISGISVAQRHASLQNAKSVLHQIEYLLSGLSIDNIVFMAVGGNAQAGLAVEDVYSSAEPAFFSVRCSDESLDLEVRVNSLDKSGFEPATRRVESQKGEWTNVEWGHLPVGAYRVQVRGSGIDPVDDVFVVVDS